MLAPSYEEACAVRSIVEAEYLGYRRKSRQEPIGYFEPPLAKFLVTRHIHGGQTASDINLRFDFHDGSACLEEQGWKFSEQLMPKKNSKWILFLSESRDGVFLTYRGDFGRIPVGSRSSSVLRECRKYWEKS